MHHTEPKNITQAIFQQKWNEGAHIIQNLGFQYDTNALLHISLDPKYQTVLKPLFHYLDNQQSLLKQRLNSLSRQQNLTTQESTANAQDIATLKQQQATHSQDISDLQQQLVRELMQQQDKQERASDITRMMKRQNLTAEEISALKEQCTAIQSEVQHLKENRHLSSGTNLFYYLLFIRGLPRPLSAKFVERSRKVPYREENSTLGTR